MNSLIVGLMLGHCLWHWPDIKPAMLSSLIITLISFGQSAWIANSKKMINDSRMLQFESDNNLFTYKILFYKKLNYLSYYSYQVLTISIMVCETDVQA